MGLKVRKRTEKEKDRKRGRERDRKRQGEREREGELNRKKRDVFAHREQERKKSNVIKNRHSTADLFQDLSVSGDH